jgi:hypothetical protein
MLIVENEKQRKKRAMIRNAKLSFIHAKVSVRHAFVFNVYVFENLDLHKSQETSHIFSSSSKAQCREILFSSFHFLFQSKTNSNNKQ